MANKNLMSKEEKEAIGKKLREARKRNKISIVQLGEMVGLHHSTISRYEQGKIDRLDIRKLKDFAKILNVEPEWFMGWDSESQKLKNIERWHNEVKETNFTDEEMEQIIDFANYILNKRKEGK